MRGLALGVAVAAMLGLPAGAGAQAAYSELAFAGDGRIFALRADGSNRAPFVVPVRRNESFESPVWSPDGRTLAYVRTVRVGREIGKDDRAQIMLRAGSSTRAVTPLRRNVIDGQPAWSPDGRRIAFARSAETHSGLVDSIRTVAPEGGPETEIARSAPEPGFSSPYGPAWRPDGKAIAYALAESNGTREGTITTIVADADGRNPRVLLKDGGRVRWSPDGRWLTFASIRDRNGERCFSDGCVPFAEIYVARGDGTGVRRLTRNRGDDQSPSWSPDGSRILFSSDRNYPVSQRAEIYSIAPDGSCLTWLTNGSTVSTTPAWRPGSTGLAVPPRCGDAGRKPLAEVKPPRRVPRDTLWLGRSYRGLMLSEASAGVASAGLDGAFFSYNDCIHFDPRRCPPEGVDVRSDSICNRNAFATVLHLRVRWRVLRGAVVGYQSAGGSLEIYSGRAISAIGFEGSFRGARGEQRRAFRALRRFGRRPAKRLRPPRITRSIAHKLRQARRTRSRKTRHRVRFARALQRADGVRIVRCR